MIDLLNKILLEFIYEEEISEGDFFFIRDLQKIISKQTFSLQIQSYHTRMGIHHCEQLTHQFFRRLDKRYDDYFTLLLDTGKIRVYDRINGSDTRLSIMSILPQGKVIDFYATNTIEDAYTYAHETMHSWNCKEDYLTSTWDLMTEGFSILTESLQQDDMEKHRTYPEYHKNKRDTYFALKQKAIALGFELDLIHFYMEYGYIDEEFISYILSFKTMGERRIIYEHLEWIFENQSLRFDKLQRDVIGGVMASYMHQRILKKPKLIGEFIELNDCCNEISFVDLLKYLDLEVEDEKLVIVSNRSLQQLDKSYQKELKSL